uniref:Uncharacterized protein n=1 Tax=Nelumbo nucifera TaxID=4432 RepID=A0A822ZMP0_NELNU|nr:TPA_asm: hypothetical protein HUJ06_004273 [Nelumbo nucifera]
MSASHSWLLSTLYLFMLGHWAEVVNGRQSSDGSLNIHKLLVVKGSFNSVASLGLACGEDSKM